MLFCVCLIGTFFWGPNEVRGEDVSEKVGILSLSTKELSPSEKKLFESSLEEGLVGLGYEIIRHKELVGPLGGSSFVSGCSFGPCTKAIYSLTGVKDVISAQMHREGSSYSIVITHLDAKESVTVSQVAEICEICTVEEAMLSVTNATIAVMTETGEAKNQEEKKKTIHVDLPKNKQRTPKRGLKKAGLSLLGVSALSVTLGVVFSARSQKALGAGFLGFGIGSALGGTGLLTFSRTF